MLMGAQNLPLHIGIVREHISIAARAVGRPVDSITLLAVTKGQSAGNVRAAAAAGLTQFGESYLQEALQKIESLRDLSLVWHFIGGLQANKTRAIATTFDWVHGVD